MNETKLINFDINSSKPIKSVLPKQLSPYNNLIDEESEIEDDNKKSETLLYEKSIDRIASSTSGIIDNTSIANSPQQMLNTSLSHEKLELNTNKETLKNCIKRMCNSEEQSSVIITKPLNGNLKGKLVGKEDLKKDNSARLISIDVMNNSAVIDATDTNTISNEVMSLSSEEETVLAHSSSEISETTLNQSRPPSIISSNNYDIKGFRLSTSALEIKRPISPSPASPVSPVSPTSVISTPSINHVIVPRSYSALAIIEDNNNRSPLRNSVSMYSNYSFSYMNSVLDDNDSESTITKKKKSVRFSNIVDVIDSNQKDTLAKLGNMESDLKNDKDTVTPEFATVINIDDNEPVDEDMKTMTSSENESKSVVMRVEEFFSVIIKYILLTLTSIFCMFNFKKDKNDREKRTNGYKNQYAIIKDSSLTNFSTEQEMGDEETFSQSSTIGDNNIQDTISQSSLNCLKELNATNVINNPKKNNNNSTLDKPLNQICVVKNNNDIELCPLKSSEEYDNSNDQLIVESEVVKRMHLPNSLSSSSFNSVSTSNSMSSTMASISYPLTINNLSKQKGNRVVRYWYNKDNKKKSIYAKLRLSKSSNPDVSKNNKQNTGIRTPMEKNIDNSKIKRSSIVNYKPTNIDINNIPNINITTTTNTILNSTSNYRNDKKNNNSSSLGKEIIIRDLNTNDKIFYSLNLEKTKTDSSLESKNCITSSVSNEGTNNDEKKDTKISDKTVTIKAPPPSLKSSRKFSHRRQNSVRLEISY